MEDIKLRPQEIIIGYAGEYNARSIPLAFDDLKALVPDGVPVIFAKRPREDEWYPAANTTVEDGKLVWIFSAFDAAVTGIGYCHIAMMDPAGNVKATSNDMLTRVSGAQRQVDGAPDAYQSWVDALVSAGVAYAQTAVDAKRAAEEYAAAAALSAEAAETSNGQAQQAAEDAAAKAANAQASEQKAGQYAADAIAARNDAQAAVGSIADYAAAASQAAENAAAAKGGAETAQQAAETAQQAAEAAQWAAETARNAAGVASGEAAQSAQQAAQSATQAAQSAQAAANTAAGVGTAVSAGVQAVKNQQTTSVNAVAGQQATSVQAVKDQQTASVQAVATQQTASVSAVQSAGTEAAQQVEQVKATIPADYTALSNNVTALKSDIAELIISPELRDGSAANPLNTNAVSFKYVQPNHGKRLLLTCKRPFDPNGVKYVAYITMYSRADGEASVNDRMINDAMCDMVNGELYINLDRMTSTHKGFAVHIIEKAADGTTIPMRVDSFNAGDVALKIVPAAVVDKTSALDMADVPYTPEMYEYGALSGANGTTAYSRISRVTMRNVQRYDKETVLHIKTGYRAYVCYYTDKGVFVKNDGWHEGSYTVPAGSYIKVQAALLNDTETPLYSDSLYDVLTYQTEVVAVLKSINPDDVVKTIPIRDGSATNPVNANGVAPANIIPTLGYERITVRFKRPAAAGRYYRFQLTTYTVDSGDSVQHQPERIENDINYDSFVNSQTELTLGTDKIGGIAKGFSVAVYERDASGNAYPLRVANLDADVYEVVYSHKPVIQHNCVIDATLHKTSVNITPAIRTTQNQAFAVADGYIYSVSSGAITKQVIATGEVVQTKAVSIGHANSLQIGEGMSRAYASGWDDSKIYVIDLVSLVVVDTIVLPMSGYTTGVVDERRGVAYVFQRETSPSTPDYYNFIVYDYVHGSIVSTKKTVKFGAMQDCDLYADRIIVANGTATEANPNGCRVYSVNGDVIGEYRIDDIDVEYEGVAFDHENGNLYIGTVNGVTYLVS